MGRVKKPKKSIIMGGGKNYYYYQIKKYIIYVYLYNIFKMARSRSIYEALHEHYLRLFFSSIFLIDAHTEEDV